MGKLSHIGHALYQGQVSINFVGRKWLWYTISGFILLLAVYGLVGRGINLGIEFEGGVEYRVAMPAGQATDANVEKIRDAVARQAQDSDIAAASSPIVNTSTGNIRVQTEPLDNDQADVISAAIQEATGVDRGDISEDAIGATWGAQVAQRALLGLVVFLVLVVLFIWAYFREWKMSVGAIVALAHDLVITIGVYALSGFEVTPATVTGILTILGFSLYDTVVVFDKVRENTKNLARTRQTYAEAANLAVNQTLVRSINTTVVALLPVGALLYVGVASLGSGALKDLSLALFVGMAAGAYSSIFIATPLVVQLKELEPGIKAGDARAMRHRDRKTVDPYAAVPAFTEDMPVHEDPGDRPRERSSRRRIRAGRGRRQRSGQRARTAPALHRGGAARVPAGVTVGVGQTRPADPQAQVAARQAVTAAPEPTGTALRERLTQLVKDVPDFPQPGVTFKDITPLLADHDAFSSVIDALADAGRDADGTVVVDKVVGMEARGFILAAPVALALGAGFVPVRKAGKLPGRRTPSPTRWSTARPPWRCTATASPRVSGCSSSTTSWPRVARPTRPVSSSSSVAVEVHALAVLMELSALHGRDAIENVSLHSLQTV